MIGTEFGNYRVTSRLGEGGMGTVYRAVDTMLDRDVALKVLRPELARQAALVDRFRAEAVALARLRHENIAALYGLDRQGDELVMVMEYVSGETLEARLHRAGAMAWDEARPVLRGVLAALGHAHARGVVHRDIKPANVMIDADGTVKVMDFGIARLIGENRQTRAGVAVGTPSYMAPEQLRGEDVDGRTDLYAAGALLFELLTGRVAFQADSDYALMMQQLHEPPPAPSSVQRSVPRSVDAVVARAMAKRPAQRYESASGFMAALDAAEQGAAAFTVEPVRAVAATVAARAPRDWRIYAIGACLLIVAGFGAAAMRPKPAPAMRDIVLVDTASALPVTPGAVIAAAPIASATPVAMAAGLPPSTVGSSVGVGTGTGPAPVETDAPVRPAATPPPTRTAKPVRSATTPPAATPPAAPRTTRATPPADAPPPAARPRVAADDGADAGARRARDAAHRCVAAIEGNDAGDAARLLRGASDGLRTAIRDGRITAASAGAADVDQSPDRVTARVSVRLSWRTAFGGNKSGTAMLVASASRDGEGWHTSGCSVERDGGVR
ncbi:MAG: protein kinase [Gemmatimonadaceae bacterium]|nr:protein kinase [Gemmatimonadaceae bacterium]